jgi:hypothetical protein
VLAHFCPLNIKRKTSSFRPANEGVIDRHCYRIRQKLNFSDFGINTGWKAARKDGLKELHGLREHLPNVPDAAAHPIGNLLWGVCRVEWPPASGAPVPERAREHHAGPQPGERVNAVCQIRGLSAFVDYVR